MSTLGIQCPKCGMILEADKRLMGAKVSCYACECHFILETQKSTADLDFVFTFTCSKCGTNSLFGQYVLDCRCPQCQAGMNVSNAKINISGNVLKKRLWDLLLKKEQGDVVARRTLAVLSDSPDASVRELIEKNHYEKFKGYEFQPLMPLEPERKPEPVSEPEKNLPSSAPKRTVEVKCPYCSRKKLIPTSFLGLYIKCNVCNSTFPTKSSGASSSGRTKVTPPPPSSTVPKRTVEVKCPYCSRKKLISTSFLGLDIKCNVCNSTFPAKSSNRR